MDDHLLHLVTIPLFTGAIGYVTNWSGVWMLLYPVRFRGVRIPALAPLVRLLPRKLQQVPGMVHGGVGWQGIIPSRAAKMGSIAVDKGIAKLGSPAEFYKQLEPDKIAEHILATAREDIRDMVEEIMMREHPRLWLDLPPDRHARRSAARHRADGHPPHRGEPRADEPDLGLFLRRQNEVADVYAGIIADDVVTLGNIGRELLEGPRADRTRRMIERALRPAVDRAVGRARAAVRVAVGTREYDAIRESVATEGVDYTMTPLSDPAFNRRQSASVRALIAARMREMPPADFSEMLRTAIREDEWLLYLHGAVLGFGAGLLHLAIFG